MACPGGHDLCGLSLPCTQDTLSDELSAIYEREFDDRLLTKFNDRPTELDPDDGVVSQSTEPLPPTTLPSKSSWKRQPSTLLSPPAIGAASSADAGAATSASAGEAGDEVRERPGERPAVGGEGTPSSGVPLSSQLNLERQPVAM